MKYFCLTIVLTLCFAGTAVADIVRQSTANDVTILSPEHAAWYFGTLSDMPHTYALYLDESLEATFEVLVPATKDSEPMHAAIIVKQAERGVTEVARLTAEQATWDKRFDFATGDSYLVGSAYTATLEPGIYTVQVYSPDNYGPYALRFGDAGSLSGHGYFGKLAHLKEIKALHGKSAFSMLASPYVFVPIVVLMSLAVWLYRRKMYA